MFEMHPGERYGRLTLISESRVGTQKVRAWECRCDCGAIKVVRASNLRDGHSKSCGCLSREAASARQTTHGMRNAPEYTTWEGIKYRCHNKKAPGYQLYGAKGITVCDEWRNNFARFFADMGPKPTPKHTIDRIDNSKGYSPGNCRWATSLEQARNKRSVRLSMEAARVIRRLHGFKMSIHEIARVYGVRSGTIDRIISGEGWVDPSVAGGEKA